MNEQYRFQPVIEQRGLWLRNGHFYAKLGVPGKGTRFLSLLDPAGLQIDTLPEAITRQKELLAERDAGRLVANQAPRLSKAVKDYLAWNTATKAKSPLTLKRECVILAHWVKFIGQVRLSHVTSKMLREYALQRTETGLGAGSLNLEVLVLGNLFQWVQKNGELPPGSLVTASWEALKYVAPRRTLLSETQFWALVTEARRQVGGVEPLIDAVPRHPNGAALANLILFMAYSGARRQAALTAKWENVDWENKQLTLYTKFDKKVVVDFNPKLEEHLTNMFGRVTTASLRSPWIFPSPDDSLKCWSNPGMLKARIAKAAGVPDFRFHDLRHYFISHCIMSGIDTLTVASWVGHADGGVLIGKVYGHLNPQHKRDAAQRLQL